MKKPLFSGRELRLSPMMPAMARGMAAIAAKRIMTALITAKTPPITDWNSSSCMSS